MSEWLSVQDRVPVDDAEVLFYVKELNQIELGKYNELTGKWIKPFSESYYHNGANWVTHWMSLPEPPIK